MQPATWKGQIVTVRPLHTLKTHTILLFLFFSPPIQNPQKCLPNQKKSPNPQPPRPSRRSQSKISSLPSIATSTVPSLNKSWSSQIKVIYHHNHNHYLFDYVYTSLHCMWFWFLLFWTVLSAAPGDEDALRCKIVALIKCDKIDDALAVILKVPNDFSYFKV